MALDKNSLEEKLKKLFDLDQEPRAENPTECASLICNYIDEYLSEAELNPFPAPGIQPGTPPIPDPNFGLVLEMMKVKPSVPLVVGDLTSQFKIALTAVMSADNTPGQFDPACGLAFNADILALLQLVSDDQGYEAAGAVVAQSPPSIDAAFNKGKEGLSHEEVAKELAKQIHDSVTSTVFTAVGPYAKATFVQTPPVPLYSSNLK